jgi:hypothetical protein
MALKWIPQESLFFHDRRPARFGPAHPERQPARTRVLDCTEYAANESSFVMADKILRSLARDISRRQWCIRRIRQSFRFVVGAYAFLSQIIPYQDSELEQLYTYARFLLLKLPRRKSGLGYEIEDEVALKFYRLQKISEGGINLSPGDADPLKGPSPTGRDFFRFSGRLIATSA